MNDMRTGKVAMVTGAGSGIGRATALGLVQAGYRVVLAGRRREALAETARFAANTGDDIESAMLICPTDVGDAASVSNLFEQTVATYGRVDLLFNNAGTNVPPVPLDELDVESWQRVVAANLTGPFLCTREAFRVMKRQSPRGGRIINNGSVSAHAPRPNSAPYTATKHAITGLTKSTALDGRPWQITCGQIDIGNAQTEMTERMKSGVPQANGTLAVEPTMDVAAVVRAVLYMDSLPLDANVLFLTVMASSMPLVGRG
jgi:NAD(P)-dependent dehydrogenase (short-subunit alcohol dehydrogenase family)